MKGCFWYLLIGLIVLLFMYFSVLVLGNLFITLVELIIGFISLIISTIINLWVAIII